MDMLFKNLEDQFNEKSLSDSELLAIADKMIEYDNDFNAVSKMISYGDQSRITWIMVDKILPILQKNYDTERCLCIIETYCNFLTFDHFEKLCLIILNSDQFLNFDYISSLWISVQEYADLEFEHPIYQKVLEHVNTATEKEDLIYLLQSTSLPEYQEKIWSKIENTIMDSNDWDIFTEPEYFYEITSTILPKVALKLDSSIGLISETQKSLVILMCLKNGFQIEESSKHITVSALEGIINKSEHIEHYLLCLHIQENFFAYDFILRAKICQKIGNQSIPLNLYKDMENAGIFEKFEKINTLLEKDYGLSLQTVSGLNQNLPTELHGLIGYLMSDPLIKYYFYRKNMLNSIDKILDNVLPNPKDRLN